jgi:transcriptional regulator with XRE-family HTH domain
MGQITATDLAGRREALGLTQRQLAERFGVHYLTISKWERGLHRIPEMVDLALMTLERRHTGAGGGR